MVNNHQYNTPQKGTRDWHTPLNENFKKLDVDVEVRDTESNLEDYQPKAGAKFFATDSEVIYIGDGTTWHPLKTTGQRPELESVRTHRINNKYTISTADGFGELVSSLDKDEDNRVYIEISDDIEFTNPPPIGNLPHDSVISGGAGHEILFSHVTDDPSFEFDGQSGVKLENLRLLVPDSAGPIIYFNDTLWEPCKFEFDGIEFRNTGGGPALAGNRMPWANFFKRCEFTGMAGTGASAYVRLGGIHNQFYGCHFYEIDSTGVAIEPTGGPADEWLFHGCTFGGNQDYSGSGINCFNEDTSDPMGSVSVIACSFEYLTNDSGADAYGIRAWGRTNIVNCYFKDVTTGVKARYVAPNQSYETIIRQPQFQSGITDYAIDAKNGGENHIFVTPLRDNWSIRDPDLNVYGRSLCRSGTVSLDDGTATVDTEVSSDTATFDISFSVRDSNATISSKIVRQGSSGTYLVMFTQEAGSATSPTILYRIIQRSP